MSTDIRLFVCGDVKTPQRAKGDAGIDFYVPNFSEQFLKDLTEKRIGYDFQKDKTFDWERLAKKKDKMKGIEKYWLANYLSKNYGDIMAVDRLPKCDLLTFSFPCQSISVAGKQHGIVAGETRSGLVYEIIRLLETAKENDELPKYLLLENVKALTSKKFIGDFNNLNTILDDIGYNVYWKVLNAKDFGVPQNRERTFGIYIRKDIDKCNFEFPKPYELKLRLKDVLEDEVSEKYYISNWKTSELIQRLIDEGKLPENEE